MVQPSKDNMAPGGEREIRTTRPTVAKATPADVAVAVARAGLGAIPIVGALAAEIATAIIPGQRLDRIQEFLELLSVKLAHLEASFVEQRMKSVEGVDLLEDCFYGAARATTRVRLEQLANLYANGMSQEAVEHETNKKMAELLNQLTDAEVIWLAHVAQLRAVSDPPDQRYADVLAPRIAAITSPVEEVDAEAVQAAWKNKLIRLGLARRKIRTAFGREPEIDNVTGDWKRDAADATWLGRMLLGYIGIAEPLRAPRAPTHQPVIDEPDGLVPDRTAHGE